MYILLAIFLCFAALFAFNWLASAAAVVLWRMISPRAKNWSAIQRAKIIFAFRVFPIIGALIFVLAFLLPAFLLFEPYNTKEVVTYKLALPALLSVFGILLAAFRVGGKLWKTRRLIAGWLVRAEKISVSNVEIPVYCIQHEFPLIAVVGVFSPKIFVARQIFDSLDAAEFRAAIAHEYGHLIAYDNLKRIILGVCRDLLVVPFGRRFDRLWSETAESAADEYAVRNGGNETAINLAAAIVKIARIAPMNATPTTLAGASLLTEQTGDVTWRVRHLLWLSEIELSRVKNFWARHSSKIYLACVPAVGLLAVNRDFLQNVHFALEKVVHILQ